MLKHVPVRHVLYLMNYVLYCKIIREDICKRSPSLGNPESAQHVMNLLNYMHCTVPESVQHVLNLMNYMYCTVPESAQHAQDESHKGVQLLVRLCAHGPIQN